MPSFYSKTISKQRNLLIIFLQYRASADRSHLSAIVKKLRHKPVNALLSDPNKFRVTAKEIVKEAEK